jgi:hypothetical protein
MVKRNLYKQAIYSLVYILAFTLPLHAQQIKGQVRDSKTSEVLPFVNVFINGTTIGAASDLNGFFTVSAENISGTQELVVSFVGYWPYKIRINVIPSIIELGVIKLIPSEIELSSVEVSANKDAEWERKLKKFRKIFLGDDKQASACTILNSWVIDFPEGNDGSNLIAKASTPIEIINAEFGYKIYFYLANFWANKSGYIISGNSQFQEMQSDSPKDLLRWEKNRKQAYKHSLHHLFKSMIEKRIRGEGFSLYNEASGFKNATTRSGFFYQELGTTVIHNDTSKLITRSAQGDYYKIAIAEKLEVHYNNIRTTQPIYQDFNGPVSWIISKTPSIKVTPNGYPFNPSDIIVEGALSSNRVARMLPFDYRPLDLTPELSNEDLTFFKEQFYIHSDRTYYYPGETIWFKGYINYAMPAWRDSLSRTIYVELIEKSKQKIVASKTVRIDSGFFYNEIVLPRSMEKGNYYLRAYTNLARNFGTKGIYTKPVIILQPNESIQFDSAYSTPPSTAHVVKCNTAKLRYHARELVTLNFEVNDEEGIGLASNLSVSVTDITHVKSFNPKSTILTAFLKEVENEEGTQMTKLLFPVEQGINFSGKYLDEKKKPVSQMLEVIQLNSDYTMTNSNEKGEFAINGLVFNDTVKFLIRPVERKRGWKAGTVEVMAKVPPPIGFEEGKIEEFKIINNEKFPFQLSDSLYINTTVLKPVEVSSKKIVSSEQLDRTKRPFGRPDYVLTRKDINGSYGNLLQILPGKFPGLIVRQGTNSVGEVAWFVYLAKAGQSSSILNPAEVLVTINDVVVSGKPEQIISAIDPNTVESIEIKTGVNVLFGSLGGNGILAIYTRKDFDKVSSIDQSKQNGFSGFSVVGYSKPKQFKFSTFEERNQRKGNLGSTIYWNHNVITLTKNGKTSTSFYAPSLPGSYQVVAEGINEKGEPIRCVHFLNVVDE